MLREWTGECERERERERDCDERLLSDWRALLSGRTALAVFTEGALRDKGDLGRELVLLLMRSRRDNYRQKLSE